MNESKTGVVARSLPLRVGLPRPRPGTVERLRLEVRLDAGADAGIILVAAPAGYGKTTLVSTWARRRRESTVWLTLEPADDDPRRFYGLVEDGLSSALDETPARGTEVVAVVPPSPERVTASWLEIVVRGCGRAGAGL